LGRSASSALTIIAMLSSKSEKNPVVYINGKAYTINKSSLWLKHLLSLLREHFQAVRSNEEIVSISKENKLVAYD
jgi:hypothetical protein